MDPLGGLSQRGCVSPSPYWNGMEWTINIQLSQQRVNLQQRNQFLKTAVALVECIYICMHIPHIYEVKYPHAILIRPSLLLLSY